MLELLELSAGALAAGVGVTMIAALLHGTIGFGFGLVSVSILALIDPRLAPVPQIVMSLPMALFMALRERGHADWGGVRFILLGAAPGTALGALIVRTADTRALDMALGAAVLIAVLLLARGRQVARTRASLTVAGMASGAMGLISSIGGPPLALLYREAPGPVMRSTLASVFGLGVSFAIAARVSVGALGVTDVWRGLALVPGLAAGLWLSRYTLSRVEGAPLRLGVLVVAGVAGAGLMVRSGFALWGA